MGRLLKFAALPSGEKIFFLRALLLMGRYRLALKVKPLQTLLQEIKETGELKKKRPDSTISLSRASNLVRAAGNLIPFSTCLSKTIAGYVLLAGQGYETRIHIGVSKDTEAGFEAHAWLTHKEEIIVGSLPDMQKYKELPF